MHKLKGTKPEDWLIDDYKKVVEAQKEQASEAYKKRNFLMTPEEEQAELAKLVRWKQQINDKTFVCAECKQSVCKCDSYTLEEQIANTSVKLRDGRIVEYTVTRPKNRPKKWGTKNTRYYRRKMRLLQEKEYKLKLELEKQLEASLWK
jgi:hypothetical protein